jgi:hypothetical protein
MTLRVQKVQHGRRSPAVKAVRDNYHVEGAAAEWKPYLRGHRPLARGVEGELRDGKWSTDMNSHWSQAPLGERTCKGKWTPSSQTRSEAQDTQGTKGLQQDMQDRYSSLGNSEGDSMRQRRHRHVSHAGCHGRMVVVESVVLGVMQVWPQ